MYDCCGTSQVDEMEGWEVSTLESVSLLADDTSLTVLFPDGSSAEPAYFTAPQDFIGNKVQHTSYTCVYSLPQSPHPIEP